MDDRFTSVSKRLDEEVQKLSSEMSLYQESFGENLFNLTSRITNEIATVNEKIDNEVATINARIRNLEDALSAVLLRIDNAASSLNGGSCGDATSADFIEGSRRILNQKDGGSNVDGKLDKLESILEKIYGKLEAIEE